MPLPKEVGDSAALETMQTMLTSTNFNSTSTMPTLDSMRKVTHDFEAKFPKSERAVCVRMGRRMIADMRNRFPAVQSSPIENESFLGLKVEVDESVCYPAYVIEMADGTEVVYCDDLLPIRRPIKRLAL